MFSKIFASSAVILALAFQVNAHAAVMPVMGVANPVRADVKRPNDAAPCGRGVDIAAGMESSEVAVADASGQVSGTVVNFNRLLDGSRKMTAQVDPTGTGTNFVPMTITKNGQTAPATLGQEPLEAQLPSGIQCTGGSTGDKCLVQFKNAVGFGACMVVQQTPATGTVATAGTVAVAGTVAATGTAATAEDTSGDIVAAAPPAPVPAPAKVATPAPAAAAKASGLDGLIGGGAGGLTDGINEKIAGPFSKVLDIADKFQARDRRAVGSRAARALRGTSWRELDA